MVSLKLTNEMLSENFAIESYPARRSDPRLADPCFQAFRMAATRSNLDEKGEIQSLPARNREESASRRYWSTFLLVLQLLLWIVAAILLALVLWSLRPSDNGDAVVRVSLDKVPEERVVRFGHADREWIVGESVPREQAAPPELAESKPAPQLQPVRKPASRSGEPTARSAAYVKPDANGVLPIGYSLTEGISTKKGGVGVPKTIASEQGVITGLTIFLIGGSLIEVDRGALVAALSQIGASEKAAKLPPAGENGRLSLDRVRTAGLNLSYDAVRDRLVLKP